jgi:hypothetical protein
MALIARGGGSMNPPGIMKQFAAMQNKGQLECFSIEDLKQKVPLHLMVNPFATRLVRWLTSSKFKVQERHCPSVILLAMMVFGL